MKFRLALLAFSVLTAPTAVLANYCTGPQTRTNETISGVVNTYYPVTQNIGVGAGTITIGSPRGASADLRVGDLVLFWTQQRAQANLIGTQDDTYGGGDTGGRGYLDANDSGKFQWMRVAGLNGASGVTGDLVRSAGAVGEVSITVTNGGGGGPFTPLEFVGPGSSMPGSAQVVRVPQYGNATISGTVTAVPYRQTKTSGNGGPQSTGGIVALDVAGTLTFAPGGKIDVNGMGFRGGAAQRFDGKASGIAATNYYFSPFAGNPAGSTGAGGIKGESIAGTPRRVVDQGQLVDGLNYTGTGTVSVDGYGSTATPAAWGKGAPSNGGGGATDQCPQGTNGTHNGTSLGVTNTMCRLHGAASGVFTTYAFNRLNTGGGGGAGYGDGGTGGGHDNDGVGVAVSAPQGGGIGGKGIDSFTKYPDEPIPGGFHQIAIMGGGGGAGSTNAATSPMGDAAVGDLQSSGATGGGVVLIRTGIVAGSGTIAANGDDARNVTATDTEYPSVSITGGTVQGNAGGGGGGGGWILVAARQASTPTLTLEARGGKGGNSNLGMGAGGGGGGGFVGVSTTITGASAFVSGGARGEIGLVDGGKILPKTSAPAMNSASVATGEATAGLAGTNATFLASALSVPAGTASAGNRAITSSSVAPGPQCVPYVKKQFSDDNGATWQSSITMAQDATFKMRIQIENSNEDAFLSGSSLPQAFQDLAFTDTYPAGIRNAAVPNVTHNNCSSPSIAAAPNGGSITISGNAAIDGQQTCTITVDLKAIAPGPSTNTIPAGAVTVVQLKEVAGQNPLTLASYEEVSASVTVPAGVGATKSSVVVSDPVNNLSSPKRIPGALIDYTVAIDNPTATVLDNDTMIIVDALPTTVNLFVGNLSTGEPSATGAPFEFTPNASNLTCAHTSLSSTTDCIDFSTNGSDWDYVPSPNLGDGTDAAVRFIRFSTSGSMAGSSNFSLRYRVKLK